MKILAIESSNQTMSVATVEDGRVIAEYTRNGNLQHSTQLMPAIEKIMSGSKWRPAQLDAIAVAKGPGSYTGVRIGATVAKTLAWTLNIPLIPVSSLAVLAGNHLDADIKIVPLIDARRKNVYTGVYQQHAGRLVNVVSDVHVNSDVFFSRLSEYKEDRFLFVGQDVDIYQSSIQARLGDRARFSSEPQRLPRAGVLGLLALREEPQDAHLFTPAYLKHPEAEEKWLATHDEERKDGYVERID